jgi:hypothetical protein
MRLVATAMVGVILTLGAIVALTLPVGAHAYDVKLSPELIEALEREDEQQAAEGAERAAKEAKEKEEQEHAAKEAQIRQEKERSEQEAAQQAVAHKTQEEFLERERKAEEEPSEPKTNEASTVQCIVPSLAGHSLSQARRTLHRAHCSLGKVRNPRATHGTLVVINQSFPRGDKLHQGAAVAVNMGARRRR